MVICPALATPANGLLQGTDLLYKSTISLVCNEGYRSVGASSRVCQANGAWSNQAFACKGLLMKITTGKRVMSLYFRSISGLLHQPIVGNIMFPIRNITLPLNQWFHILCMV